MHRSLSLLICYWLTSTLTLTANLAGTAVPRSEASLSEHDILGRYIGIVLLRIFFLLKAINAIFIPHGIVPTAQK